MTIGDVLAVFLALVLTSMAWIATLTVFPLLFPNYVQNAESTLKNRPRASFVIGLLTLTFTGFALVIIWGKALPILRVFAFAAGAYEVFMIAGGCAAICSAAAERLAGQWPNSSIHTSRLRTAALLTAAGWVPVAGWFLAIPFAAATAFGASLLSMFARKPLTDELVITPAFRESLP